MALPVPARLSVPLFVAVLLTACGPDGPTVDPAVPEEAGSATVRIASPDDGATVPADEPVALDVELQGAWLEGQPETDGVQGHLHVFVDGQIVGMPSELAPEVTLEPGTHTIRVEFVDELHRSLATPVDHEIQVTAQP